MTRSASCRPGFSLVEILIVVTIIGILAAIAIPKFVNASVIARESSLKTDLQHLRTQVGVYRTQHREVYPGYPGGNDSATATSAIAIAQLTKFTDPQGNTSDSATASCTLPPLLLSAPVNPLNSKSDFAIIAATGAFTPTGDHGWLYQPSTGIVKADIPGNDTAGKPYIDY